MKSLLLLSSFVAAFSACSYRETHTETSTRGNTENKPAEEVAFVPGATAMINLPFQITDHHQLLSEFRTSVHKNFLAKTDIKQSDLNPGRDIAFDFDDPTVSWDARMPIAHSLAGVDLVTVRAPASTRDYSAAFSPVPISAYKLEKLSDHVTRVYLSRTWLQKILTMAKPLTQANVLLKISYHMKLVDLQSIWPNRTIVERVGVCCSVVPGEVRAGALLIPIETPHGKTIQELLEESFELERVADPIRM